MPTNVTVEYAKAQQKYLNAKTREEKIAALEEMISAVPDHKGTENLRAQLKQRLAKLKKQAEAKVARKSITIPKEGDAQVCIIGLTQSGKSTLLSKLTNAKPEISNHPYTTTKPEIGTCDYEGVKIQLIEIPSSFEPSVMNIAQNADLIILLYKDEQDLLELKNILSKFRIKKNFIEVNRDEGLEEIKSKVWNSLNLIRVYCKEPGKKPEEKPMILRKGSTIKDAAKKLHKDFLKYFRFARVWGSSKYPGEKVGLSYELKDKDILEVHMG
ncbi:MAG: TGS domain-containing protein [Candidatus Aenigmatarchaeota archaeon]